jgi:hypothetical protein
MSKIIYYIGAGASYGESRVVLHPSGLNNVDEIIINAGLPIVSEIASRLRTFHKYVDGINTLVENNVLELWGVRFGDANNALEYSKQELLKDITWLHNETFKHATIDTFAKKLYLSGNKKDYKRLEKVLCLYLVWEQLDHRGDQRYDTFLASVLTENELQLPKDISVISWNYDSQFEMAYSNYSDKHLFVFDKLGNLQELPNCGRIFKVNGSASLRTTPTPLEIIAEKVDKGTALLWYYNHCDVHVDIEGFEQIRPRLSFAWEQDELSNDSMMKAIEETVIDAEVLVVIGYSFPFFNRSVDRKIFDYMNGLDTIYIQDPFADEIKQNIQNVMSDFQKAQRVKIVTKTNCNQFFLPPEL